MVGVWRSIDQIILKLKTGAVVKFKCDASPPEGDSDASVSRNIISAIPNGKEYCWPIAEAFWLDRNTVSLPSRDAHPVLVYRRTVETAIEAATNHMLLDTLKFPADNYTMETSLSPSPPRGQRWLVYIQGSKGDGRLGECDVVDVEWSASSWYHEPTELCRIVFVLLQATRLGSCALPPRQGRVGAACSCCCRTTSRRCLRCW